MVKMNLSRKWRLRSGREVTEIANYLESNFSNQAAENFLENLYKSLDYICDYPTQGQPSRKYKAVRSYRIDDHRKIYYRVVGKELFILKIWDSRQNPQKLKY